MYYLQLSPSDTGSNTVLSLRIAFPLDGVGQSFVLFLNDEVTGLCSIHIKKSFTSILSLGLSSKESDPERPSFCFPAANAGEVLVHGIGIGLGTMLEVVAALDCNIII